MATKAHEFIVIGGGIVGAAIAEGLARRDRDVAILDEGDVAFRAARGNLGNVWVQGKGAGKPAYANLTRQCSLDWRELSDRLQHQTGIDLHYRNPGAVFICMSEEDLVRRSATMELAAKGATVKNPYKMLDHAQLADLIPQIGPEVCGGSFSKMDGTANPLRLLRAMIKSTTQYGGHYYTNNTVQQILPHGGGFTLTTRRGTYNASHIVLCAGLGNAVLAPQLKMFGDVRPVRGQIMVTERVQPFLEYGTNFIRQTIEGGCVIGESSEEVGFDTGTTMEVLAATAQKAIRAFPQLEHSRIVRSWGALRIMTRDGIPVYQMKGFGADDAYQATVVSVHSGVSLCPYHTEGLAQQIAAHQLVPDIAEEFSAERFNV